MKTSNRAVRLDRFAGVPIRDILLRREAVRNYLTRQPIKPVFPRDPKPIIDLFTPLHPCQCDTAALWRAAVGTEAASIAQVLVPAVADLPIEYQVPVFVEHRRNLVDLFSEGELDFVGKTETGQPMYQLVRKQTPPQTADSGVLQ